jgi:hypothetical protein
MLEEYMIRKIFEAGFENRTLVLAAALVLFSWAAIFYPSAPRQSIAGRNGWVRRPDSN